MISRPVKTSLGVTGFDRQARNPWEPPCSIPPHALLGSGDPDAAHTPSIKKEVFSFSSKSTWMALSGSSPCQERSRLKMAWLSTPSLLILTYSLMSDFSRKIHKHGPEQCLICWTGTSSLANRNAHNPSPAKPYKDQDEPCKCQRVQRKLSCDPAQL